MPEMKFAASASQMTGKNFSIAASGTCLPTPKTRRSTAQLVPATKPMPIVCTVRMSGNANSDSPRTHMLKSVCSSQSKNCSVGVTFGAPPEGWYSMDHEAERQLRQVCTEAVSRVEWPQGPRVVQRNLMEVSVGMGASG